MGGKGEEKREKEVVPVPENSPDKDRSSRAHCAFQSVNGLRPLRLLPATIRHQRSGRGRVVEYVRGEAVGGGRRQGEVSAN